MSSETATNLKNKEYKVMAYLTDNTEWQEHDIEADKLTHINYAFAHIREGVVVGNLQKINILNSIKKKNPHLKTVISIGGWSADGFSDAALNDESRKVFADSAIKFMLENNFDGIDLDWEYPCWDQAGIKARPEDKVNFTLMLKSLREKLDLLESKSGNHYILSIAIGAAEEIINDVEMNVIHKYLDFINLMTYDMRGSFTNITGHHTNLFSPTFDSNGISGDKASQKLLSLGVPKEKVILGAAFYSRIWKGVTGEGTGLNQLAESTGGTTCNYKDMLESYLKDDSFKRYWDDSSKAPYLFDGSTFVSYDDEESLTYKANYIRYEDLGGIMFWEYSLDNSGKLLNQIYKVLNKSSKENIA
ncbi:glycoside hydrolase family 18 protein [Clostridium swellfunianum]|uniref:glycoside hydrolase family 18 protein n=1 Tax=Clostridium swellfunianum TaxID=1367462 RepID=UPI0020304935|nr:glycoside hydrolase family 18 protein [Clostridium swellfunianum]MCM0647462.1 glycoside hydrolase family 18 protein [Clostridium swellfunianum]